MEDYIKEVQEFLGRTEVAHTLKLVPQSQRELFASELEKYIATLLAEVRKQLRKECLEEEIEILEESKPFRITEQETHHTYNDGMRDAVQISIDYLKKDLAALDK